MKGLCCRKSGLGSILGWCTMSRKALDNNNKQNLNLNLTLKWLLEVCRACGLTLGSLAMPSCTLGFGEGQFGPFTWKQAFQAVEPSRAFESRHLKLIFLTGQHCHHHHRRHRPRPIIIVIPTIITCIFILNDIVITTIIMIVITVIITTFIIRILILSDDISMTLTKVGYVDLAEAWILPLSSPALLPAACLVAAIDINSYRQTDRRARQTCRQT